MASSKTNKFKPSGRSGARQFAGQTLSGLNAKRGGGGNYNWGNPMDNYEDEYGEEDYEDEEEEANPSLLTKMRAASLVQEKAAAAQERRAMAAAEPAPVAAPAWGQHGRLEAMKDRLLAIERAKIASMAPERLELMNLLADHGHMLDENTLTALLKWKNN